MHHEVLNRVAFSHNQSAETGLVRAQRLVQFRLNFRNLNSSFQFAKFPSKAKQGVSLASRFSEMLSFHVRHETFKPNLSFFSKLSLHIKFYSDHQNPNPQIPKSLLTLIDDCCSLPELKQIHCKSIISGLTYNQFILTKFSESFLLNEDLDYAVRIFYRTHEPNLLIWNSLIRSFSSSETPFLAISLYNKMRISENIKADNYTYPSVFRACANVSAIEKGREVHGQVTRVGL